MQLLRKTITRSLFFYKKRFFFVCPNKVPRRFCRDARLYSLFFPLSLSLFLSCCVDVVLFLLFCVFYFCSSDRPSFLSLSSFVSLSLSHRFVSLSALLFLSLVLSLSLSLFLSLVLFL